MRKMKRRITGNERSYRPSSRRRALKAARTIVELSCEIEMEGDSSEAIESIRWKLGSASFSWTCSFSDGF